MFAKFLRLLCEGSEGDAKARLEQWRRERQERQEEREAEREERLALAQLEHSIIMAMLKSVTEAIAQSQSRGNQRD